MTDGAARLLSRHLAPPNTPPSVNLPTPAETARRQEQETARRVFKRAYHRLISRHPSVRWTSGQWMTERPGGSDVSRSETTAVHEPVVGSEELGPWVINGYKFFSSATDADMTILLARTPNHKGLSCFYAPMKLANGERNGVRIIRLKKKLGTKPLPTAELELKGMRAWMVGEEGEGIREIATILNVTRVHNSIMAVASMRRALNVAKAYSRVRTVAGGRILSTVPLHLRTLAQMELLTRASTHLGFLTVHLLSLSENPATALPTPLIVPSGAATALLRFLTPLTKAVTAKMCLSVISESVEALGGIGYLENEEPLNLARLLRDAQVLSIWEGTTNVLINDLVTSLKRPSKAGGEERYYSVLNDFIQENLGNGGGNIRGDIGDILERAKVVIWTEWKKIEETIEAGSREELTANGRRLMWSLAYVVVGTMLLVDARRDGEASAVEAVKRWVLRREIGLNGERGQKAGENGTEGDAVLVFGDKAEVHKNGQHKL
jgi:alkylation response protein AidB-like acyl-CoA dehydrogenase